MVRKSIVLVPLALAAALLFAASATAASGPNRAWSRAVTQICAHGLLFDGRHEVGTEADALAVAEDIRATTARRLVLVAALPPPVGLRAVAARWLTIEQRLAAIYAHSYVRMFEVIDAGSAPGQRAHEAQVVSRLLGAPDRLQQTAAVLEGRLRVPDCTGGVNPASPGSDIAMVAANPWPG
jgi:hypothetical protein